VIVENRKVMIRRIEYDVETEIQVLQAIHYLEAEWLASILRIARYNAPS
jgi:hypothetical protein